MSTPTITGTAIEGSVVLVTGANRGIGAEFVRQLRDRGAAKIYAGVRNPDTYTPEDGVVPVRLDVTKQDEIQAAAATASDVQIIINNAGIADPQPLLTGDLGILHDEIEINAFGPLYVTRAFAPVLKANGGGTILNSLSAVSWVSFPGLPGYSASKAAAWSLTDGLRRELAEQRTSLLALHMGPVDTQMGTHFPLDKVAPEQVVTAALDGVEAGATEVLADQVARDIKNTLTLDPSRYTAIFGN
jgi:NAD(P)-dependent dehydrogenase (short-subunit alcohol dehydrogenase family)